MTIVTPGGASPSTPGPASCLMDLHAARITQGAQAADVDGRIARAGHVRPDLLARLLTDSVLRLAQRPNRPAGNISTAATSPASPPAWPPPVTPT